MIPRFNTTLFAVGQETQLRYLQRLIEYMCDVCGHYMVLADIVPAKTAYQTLGVDTFLLYTGFGVVDGIVKLAAGWPRPNSLGISRQIEGWASIRVFHRPACNDRAALLTIRPPGSCPLQTESAGFPPSGRRHFLQNARSVKSWPTQGVPKIALRHGTTLIAKLAARDKAVGSTPTGCAMVTGL